ncbi:MAG: hypothetical protein J7L11_06505 [Thermoprotei archaeon]|nr:hypothetical protein [Thermoprotei archaeon]
MRNKGIMGIIAIMIVLLSMLGAAYAAWTDTVRIEVEAKMGEFIVGILDKSVSCTETTNGVPEEQFKYPKPWVANCSCTLSDFETSVHHTPPQTVAKRLDIKLVNAYPQWDVHIRFKLKNAGTIPAKLVEANMTGRDLKDDEDLTININWYFDTGLGAWVGEGEVIDPTVGTAIINLHIEVFVPEDYQLEPCTEYPVYLSLDFKQEAEECHTYLITLQILAVQWNKAEEYMP